MFFFFLIVFHFAFKFKYLLASYITTGVTFHSLDFQPSTHINLTQPGVGRKANLAWIRKLELYKLNWFFFLLSNQFFFFSLNLFAIKIRILFPTCPLFGTPFFILTYHFCLRVSVSYLRFLWVFFFFRFFFLNIYSQSKIQATPNWSFENYTLLFFLYIIFIDVDFLQLWFTNYLSTSTYLHKVLEWRTKKNMN